MSDTIMLGFLRDGRLRVVQPIEVAISKQRNRVVCEARGIDEFGYGSNVSEAISDLQRAIVELYFRLNSCGRFSRDLLRTRKRLNEMVVTAQQAKR